MKMRERTRDHPCLKKHLLDIFGPPPEVQKTDKKKRNKDPRYKKLSRLLLKQGLRRFHKIMMVGTVQEREWGGRPENVYCMHRIHPGWLTHDAGFTDVFQALGWPEVIRGGNVERVPFIKDGKVEYEIIPDAITLHPRKRFWEYDRGTEVQAEIERKARAFQGKKTGVLFVATSRPRMLKIIEWTKEIIPDVGIYAVKSELIANPTGEVWITATGVKKQLTFTEVET